MEEKNKASDLLHQMKRYIHSDKHDELVESEVPSDEVVVQEAPAVPQIEEKVAEPIKEAPKEKPKARRLPDDEALFEFDEVAFDDVMVPDPPVLTPEEEERADEIREKFGVSSGIGISFINEEPEDEHIPLAPPICEEITEEAPVEEAPVVEEALVEEAPVEEAPVFEEVPLTVAPATDENEPEQVVFAETQSIVEQKEVKPIHSDALTTSGEQVSFFNDDGESFDEPFEEPEQVSFDDAEDIDDDIDEDFDEDIDEDIDEEISTAHEAAIEYSEIAATEHSEAETTEYSEEESATVTEKLDEIPPEQLTPIEISAMEEEKARLAAEAEQAEAEKREKEAAVPTKTHASDVWDDADRPVYQAKKRYMDFCEGLVVPPVKVTKDSPIFTPPVKPEASGYRYEMTERLPVFPDGRNGGKYTEGYRKREIEYQEERESKRSAQLIDRLRSMRNQLIFSFVIMLSVILIESIVTAINGSRLSEGNAMIFGLSIAALLIIGSFLVLKPISDGIKCAFSGIFIPETLTAGVVIASVIYHIAVAFVGENAKYAILFGTGAAISMFLVGLYRYLMCKRDHTAFIVTSSYGAYLTEVRIQGYRNTPEGIAFGDYTDSDASLYKFNRVSRIDGSYDDKPVRDECFGLIRKLSICIVCVAVAVGVIFGIVKNDVMYGVLSAISMLTYAAPISTLVALAVPRVRAASVSAECGGAIVDFDDESDELDSSVIMIDDGELFPTENLISSNFEIYSASVEAHLARTLALFKKIGGPIAVVFNNVEGTVDNFESIHITDISEHGIMARIDGKPICAGTEAFMKGLGIKIKRYDKSLPKNGRVMYIADDGEFFARLILIFRPDEELVRKISELRNTDTVFSLKTCNPCIDKELLFYTTGLEPDLIRLIKYKAGDDVAPAETDREGSLVSKGGALGLITALLEYKRQKKLIFGASRFACVSCIIGAFISLILSIVGLHKVGCLALITLALHGVLSAAALLLSLRGAIDTKTKIKKK